MGGPAKTNMKYEEEEKNKEMQLKPMAGFKDIYYIFEYLFYFCICIPLGEKMGFRGFFRNIRHFWINIYICYVLP